MIKLAFVKGKGKSESTTLVKTQSEEFTTAEHHVLENGLRELRQAQVTGPELAVNELYSRKIGLVKVALVKQAGFVFALWKGRLAHIEAFEGLIRENSIVHKGGKIKQFSAG